MVLWTTFIYLTIQASCKYYSEPISSNVYQTIGDDGQIFEYPDVTICLDKYNPGYSYGTMVLER